MVSFCQSAGSSNPLVWLWLENKTGRACLRFHQLAAMDAAINMRAVAVPALGRARSAHRVAHAMNAVGVGFGFLVVATGAVGRRNICAMNQFLDAVVTINAIQLAVDRPGKTVNWENGERDFFPVHQTDVFRIQMTIETIGAGKFLNRVRCAISW